MSKIQQLPEHNWTTNNGREYHNICRCNKCIEHYKQWKFNNIELIKWCITILELSIISIIVFVALMTIKNIIVS